MTMNTRTTSKIRAALDMSASSPAHCECGQITGCYCDAPLEDDAILIEHMPERHRRSHELARRRGCWPHNGSVRLWLAPVCAAEVVDGDWTAEVTP